MNVDARTRCSAPLSRVRALGTPTGPRRVRAARGRGAPRRAAWGPPPAHAARRRSPCRRSPHPRSRSRSSARPQARRALDQEALVALAPKRRGRAVQAEEVRRERGGLVGVNAGGSPRRTSLSCVSTIGTDGSRTGRPTAFRRIPRSVGRCVDFGRSRPREGTRMRLSARIAAVCAAGLIVLSAAPVAGARPIDRGTTCLQRTGEIARARAT